MNNKIKNGKVYLIGSGPGDPKLLTLKAVECLKKSDVILFDRLISKDILKYAKPSAILKFVGKEKGRSIDQEKINQTILSFASKGKTVARVKGGDPFIFGRGQEEMLFLRENNIDCEVIPGVSSFYSVPEVCGIPLTFRGVSSGFMVLTGHEDPSKEKESINWKHAANFSGTLVIMMGLSNLKSITDKLIAFGKDPKTPSAVIQSGTTDKEKVVMSNLARIANKSADLKAPAICVIGDTVKLAYRLNPNLKPLSNKSFISTASETLNNDISLGLESLGAKVERLPMIKVVPNKDTSYLDNIIADIKAFDWLVFTSRHGVYYFLKRFFALNRNKTLLKGRIACVGSGTAGEFIKFGINPALMPDKFTTRNLAIALRNKGINDKNIALLRTSLDRDYLKGILIRAGAKLTDCTVYNIEGQPDKTRIAKALAKKSDGIFFLSPKSVKTFFANIPSNINGSLTEETPFYSIGPVTTGMLKKIGIRQIHSAKEHTVAGLIKSCLENSL
ncbi:MAG: uroporphyrinogen-III C-methyltransferase [Candidatus Omnitrophica bacterium]|nr:uroporphyrinogen-III C-methyltransferase [Candidatus Omnitrophota bacterium]